MHGPVIEGHSPQSQKVLTRRLFPAPFALFSSPPPRQPATSTESSSDRRHGFRFP